MCWSTSQMMNSGSVCSGNGISSLKPVRNSGGSTSSKGRKSSLRGPPPRRLSLERTSAMRLVRLCTMACMFVCAVRSS